MSFNDPSRATALKKYFQGTTMNPDLIAKNRASLQDGPLPSNPSTLQLIELLAIRLESLGGSLSSLREQLSPVLAPATICGETALKDDSYNTSQVNYQLIELLNRVDSMSSFVEDLSHDIAL